MPLINWLCFSSSYFLKKNRNKNMTKLDLEARKQMQLQLGAQSAEAWMLDAAVVISMEAQNSPR